MSSGLGYVPSTVASLIVGWEGSGRDMFAVLYVFPADDVFEDFQGVWVGVGVGLEFAEYVECRGKIGISSVEKKFVELSPNSHIQVHQ